MSSALQGRFSHVFAETDTFGRLRTVASKRVSRGVYLGDSGVQSIVAAGHTVLQGFFWLINPIGSPVTLGLRRVEGYNTGVAAAAANTSVTFERVTFTGTATGATITPALASGVVPAFGSIRTASTGLTLTAGASFYHIFVCGIITAAGVTMSPFFEWEPFAEEGQIHLTPGQGFVCRQPDVGVTTDPRKLIVNFAWEEF